MMIFYVSPQNMIEHEVYCTLEAVVYILYIFKKQCTVLGQLCLDIHGIIYFTHFIFLALYLELYLEKCTKPP